MPYAGADAYNNLSPDDGLHLAFHGLDAPGHGFSVDPCGSPAWPSTTLVDAKPFVDTSFFEENNPWESQYSSNNYAEQQLFALPPQDSTTNFFSHLQTSTHESLPACIAPGEAVKHLDVDYTTISPINQGWELQSPVEESNILYSSSSPAEYSPLTPSNLDYPFDASYIKNEPSPSSSLYLSRTRSTIGKKGRKSTKAQKRSTRKNIQGPNSTAIEFSSTDRADRFRAERLRTSDTTTTAPTIIQERNAKLHYCEICDARFERSEHCKRHKQKHSNEHPFKCYISGRCRVGKKKDGSQNRQDNSRQHHWTHVKAWLVANNALVTSRNKAMAKRCKGRNTEISPAEMYAYVRARDDRKQQQDVLEFLNKEAGKEFKVHIEWERQGCPVVACLGGAGEVGGCRMCRPPQGKRREVRGAARL